MKRSPRLMGLLVCAAMVASGALPGGADATAPSGWILAGSAPADYDTGTDTKTIHGGRASAFMASIQGAKLKGFGTLMEQCLPGEYLGKRVRLSAWVKSEDVRDWAGVWMRVDGNSGRMLAFDNMQSRPIKGTADWKQYEVVLDVGQDAADIAFGVLLSGAGKVWMDDVSLTVVDASVPTTEAPKPKMAKAPANLAFED